MLLPLYLLYSSTSFLYAVSNFHLANIKLHNLISLNILLMFVDKLVIVNSLRNEKVCYITIS